MYEKVNPSHPDKIADRIAGAIVDLAVARDESATVAAEVLIGHGHAFITIESSEEFSPGDVQPIVDRLCEQHMDLQLVSVKQDKHLAGNQKDAPRCGDNGIFKGVPVSEEEYKLTDLAAELWKEFPADGKYVCDMADGKITICHSNAAKEDLAWAIKDPALALADITINPLGPWTGGPDVDSGATNRKLGSDMGRAATGGGLMGKDLSKADVTVNIACHLLAQRTGDIVQAHCSIGDDEVVLRRYDAFGRLLRAEAIPYQSLHREAQEYISQIGGFEKFAEWGLIRPRKN